MPRTPEAEGEAAAMEVAVTEAAVAEAGPDGEAIHKDGAVGMILRGGGERFTSAGLPEHLQILRRPPGEQKKLWEPPAGQAGQVVKRRSEEGAPATPEHAAPPGGAGTPPSREKAGPGPIKPRAKPDTRDWKEDKKERARERDARRGANGSSGAAAAPEEAGAALGQPHQIEKGSEAAADATVEVGDVAAETVEGAPAAGLSAEEQHRVMFNKAAVRSAELKRRNDLKAAEQRAKLEERKAAAAEGGVAGAPGGGHGARAGGGKPGGGSKPTATGAFKSDRKSARTERPARPTSEGHKRERWTEKGAPPVEGAAGSPQPPLAPTATASGNGEGWAAPEKQAEAPKVTEAVPPPLPRTPPAPAWGGVGAGAAAVLGVAAPVVTPEAASEAGTVDAAKDKKGSKDKRLRSARGGRGRSEREEGDRHAAPHPGGAKEPAEGGGPPGLTKSDGKDQKERPSRPERPAKTPPREKVGGGEEGKAEGKGAGKPPPGLVAPGEGNSGGRRGGRGG
eukprot:433825-Prorocentrum_minimum.AAC.1